MTSIFLLPGRILPTIHHSKPLRYKLVAKHIAAIIPITEPLPSGFARYNTALEKYAAFLEVDPMLIYIYLTAKDKDGITNVILEAYKCENALILWAPRMSMGIRDLTMYL